MAVACHANPMLQYPRAARIAAESCGRASGALRAHAPRSDPSRGVAMRTFMTPIAIAIALVALPLVACGGTTSPGSPGSDSGSSDSGSGDSGGGDAGVAPRGGAHFRLSGNTAAGPAACPDPTANVTLATKGED